MAYDPDLNQVLLDAMQAINQACGYNSIAPIVTGDHLPTAATLLILAGQLRETNRLLAIIAEGGTNP